MLKLVIRNDFEELVRYIIAGFVFVVIFFVVSNILFQMNILPWLSTFIANCVQIVVAYFVNRHFTFRSNVAHMKSIPRYAVRSLVNILLMQFFTFFLYNVMEFSYSITSAATVCITTFVSYLLAKFWVFPRRTSW